MRDFSTKGGIPFKVTNPEKIPAGRYYDDNFFKLGAESLWPPPVISGAGRRDQFAPRGRTAVGQHKRSLSFTGRRCTLTQEK